MIQVNHLQIAANTKKSQLSYLNGWLCFVCLMLCLCVDVPSHAAEEYEIWWEKCLENSVPMSTFEGWLGDINAASRVAMRNHVRRMKYTSVLDVPAGICMDYFGFKSEGFNIKYQGVDITPKLVAMAQKQGIPVIEGDIKALPFRDNSFDVCIARHILEHLTGYEKALDELIRVCSKEALITFFMRPEEKEVIDSFYYHDYLLYGNIYNKKELEDFVLSNPKVSGIFWEEVNGREVILHVYTINS